MGIWLNNRKAEVSGHLMKDGWKKLVACGYRGEGVVRHRI